MHYCRVVALSTRLRLPALRSGATIARSEKRKEPSSMPTPSLSDTHITLAAFVAPRLLRVPGLPLVPWL